MDTASHKDTKEDHSRLAAVCFVARARVVPHRTRTGTCSKRRPRRDNVSPFEPEGSPVDGEHGIPDNPNGPTPNGVEQICIPCPKLRGSNPPPAAFVGHPRQRGTEEAGRIHPYHHHKTVTEELLTFLKRHGIECDPRCICDLMRTLSSLRDSMWARR